MADKDNIFDEQTIPFVLDSIANKENVIPREIYMDYENNQAYLRVEEGEDIPIGKKIIQDLVNDFIEKVRDGCSEDYNSFGKLERLLKDLQEFIKKMDKIDFIKIDGLKEVLLTLEGIADTEDFKSLLDKKVDKIEGKGLSTNDYDEVYDAKLRGIEKNANKFIHTIEPMCNITAPIISINNKVGTVRITKEELGLEGIEDGAGPYTHPSTLQCGISYIKILNLKRYNLKFAGINNNRFVYLKNTTKDNITSKNISLPRHNPDHYSTIDRLDYSSDNIFTHIRNYPIVSDQEIQSLSFPDQRYWTFEKAFKFIERLDASGKFNSLKKTETVQNIIPTQFVGIDIIGASYLEREKLVGSDGTVITSRNGGYFKKGCIVRAHVYTTDNRYFTDVKTVHNNRVIFNFNLLPPKKTFTVIFTFDSQGAFSNYSLNRSDIIMRANFSGRENFSYGTLNITYDYPDNYRRYEYYFEVTKNGKKYKSVRTYSFVFNGNTYFTGHEVEITVQLEPVEDLVINKARVYIYTDFLNNAITFQTKNYSRNLDYTYLEAGYISVSKGRRENIGYVINKGNDRYYFTYYGHFDYEGRRYTISDKTIYNTGNSDIIINIMKADYITGTPTPPQQEDDFITATIKFKALGLSGSNKSKYTKFKINNTNAISNYSSWTSYRDINIYGYETEVGPELRFRDKNNIRLSVSLYSNESGVPTKTIDSWSPILTNYMFDIYKLVHSYTEPSSQLPPPPPPAQRMFRVGLKTNAKVNLCIRMATETTNQNSVTYGSWYETHSPTTMYWYPLRVAEGSKVQFRVGDDAKLYNVVGVGGKNELTKMIIATQDNMIIEHYFTNSGGSSEIPTPGKGEMALYIRAVDFSSSKLTYNISKQRSADWGSIRDPRTDKNRNSYGSVRDTISIRQGERVFVGIVNVRDYETAGARPFAGIQYYITNHDKPGTRNSANFDNTYTGSKVPKELTVDLRDEQFFN